MGTPLAELGVADFVLAGASFTASVVVAFVMDRRAARRAEQSSREDRLLAAWKELAATYDATRKLSASDGARDFRRATDVFRTVVAYPDLVALLPEVLARFDERAEAAGKIGYGYLAGDSRSDPERARVAALVPIIHQAWERLRIAVEGHLTTKG